MSSPREQVFGQIRAATPIGLAEVEQSAALRTRVDRKYILDWDTVARLTAGLLAGDHRVLEIEGRRRFAYDTVYFDSATFSSYRAHLQQRRRRYKARTRQYVDSGLYMFEVKLKGKRGETIKHQMPYRAEDHGQITEPARAFLAERVTAAYPNIEVPPLAPTIRTKYQRMTFAHGAERLTCDFDLTFSDGNAELLGLAPGYAIVESKCEGGMGEADRLLRKLGARPVSCSKYCVGVGLLREDVKVNELRWLLSRYFGAVGSHIPPQHQGVFAHG